MRSSSGGWVSNMPPRLERSPLWSRSGDSMYRCAVARVTFCSGVGVVAQLGEREREALAVAGDLGGGHVGEVLAAAGQRHLQQRGADRGEDHRGDADDHA